MKYFFDTSTLVKIYHKEAGTEKALSIYKSQNSIVISELSKIEFISTVHRKFRDTEINEEVLNKVLEKFLFDIDNRYEILIFSSMVINEAFDLICKYSKKKALRTLDSIQLAFFEIYCDDSDILVCSDIKLGEIAQLENRKVLTLK